MGSVTGLVLKSWRAVVLVMVLVAASFVVPASSGTAGAQQLDDAEAQVVGGRDAGDHEFPYLAVVFFNGFQGCGGALVAADWVVSAAHCFANEPIGSIVVGFGSADLNGSLQLSTVSNVIIHPDYQVLPFAPETNDIALLKLTTPVNLADPTVGLVALRDDIELPTSDGILLVSGWGDVDPSTTFDPASIARVAQVQSTPCGSFGSGALRVCTSDADGDGACGNDSGGPLVDVNAGVHTLVAIVEGTSNLTGNDDLCGNQTLVVHQRVAPHLDWMRTATGEAFPTCNGRAVTVQMTSGVPFAGTGADDVVLGTAGNDDINTGGGNDTICARGGDDTIYAGAGNDYINGSSGRDRIYGGTGSDDIIGGLDIDYLHGEDGNDTLNGQGGSDRMYGGPGNDLMLGDSGADRMYGGPGNDEMRGMGGQDFMWGDAGDDLMQGNFQTDNMWGGPGNDDMFGAGGKDSLFGETGNDTMSGGNNTDYLDGGADIDTVNGGKGRDKPLVAPSVRASNGQFFDGSGCIAEIIQNCQPV